MRSPEPDGRARGEGVLAGGSAADALIVLVVPLERQLAEKLHAYTRQYNGATTRARDLVDFILVRQHERVDAKRLKDAIQRTFARRGTHPVPESLKAPPPELAVAYRREAGVVGVVISLEEAHKLAVQWLNPVLTCNARGSWDPSIARWVE